MTNQFPASLRMLNRKLRKLGVDRRLWRGNGYYYFDAPEWPASSVYVNHFSAFSVNGWINEFNELKTAAARSGFHNPKGY